MKNFISILSICAIILFTSCSDKPELLEQNENLKIARSGGELKKHLNTITKLPAGKIYKGNMYRSIRINNPNNLLEIHKGMVNANYRYNRPGEGGLYFSKTQIGNNTEISHYGNISDYKMYEYSNVKVDNMLDLTDAIVRVKLGIDFDLITRTAPNSDETYEHTHEIGTWAAKKEYKGLIVPGARGNKDYINMIIFKQKDVNLAMKSITPKIIRN